MSDKTLLLIDQQTFNHLLAGVRALQMLMDNGYPPQLSDIVGDDPLDSDQLDTLAENLNTSFFEPNQSDVLAHFSDPDLRHYADRANEIYANDDIEIDDDPIYSPNDTGCWVGAWVFVRNEERDDV